MPLMVKIISIIIFLSAVWIIGGIILSLLPILDSGTILQQVIEEDPDAEELRLKFENDGIEFNESNLYLLLGFGYVLMFAFGTFLILLGVFLWKGKNWARITIIVLAFIWVFFGLFGLVIRFDIFNMIDTGISLLIGVYLLVSKNVKHAFQKKPKLRKK